jgi:predicted NBD/HSP70 family sugar kinase
VSHIRRIADAVAGVDVSLHNVHVAVYLLGPDGVRSVEQPIRIAMSNDADQTLSKVATCIKTIEKSSGVTVRIVAVATPGVVNDSLGVLTFARNLPAPWQRLAIRSTLKRYMPDVDVVVGNDVQIQAATEPFGRFHRRVLYVLVDGGVGDALRHGRKVRHEEVDHVRQVDLSEAPLGARAALEQVVCGCRMERCAEAMCTFTSICLGASRTAGRQFGTLDEVTAWWRSGQPDSVKHRRFCASVLAAIIAQLPDARHANVIVFTKHGRVLGTGAFASDIRDLMGIEVQPSQVSPNLAWHPAALAMAHLVGGRADGFQLVG